MVSALDVARRVLTFIKALVSQKAGTYRGCSLGDIAAVGEEEFLGGRKPHQESHLNKTSFALRSFPQLKL